MTSTSHWRQVGWNRYRLCLASGRCLDFDSYKKLYEYCLASGIDAVQA